MMLTHRDALTAITALHWHLETQIAKVDANPGSHGLSMNNLRLQSDLTTQLAQPVINGDPTVNLAAIDHRLMVREALIGYIDFLKADDNFQKAKEFAEAYDVEPMTAQECYELLTRINV